MVQNVYRLAFVLIIRQDSLVEIIILIINGKDFVIGTNRNVEKQKVVMSYLLVWKVIKTVEKN